MDEVSQTIVGAGVGLSRLADLRRAMAIPSSGWNTGLDVGWRRMDHRPAGHCKWSARIGDGHGEWNRRCQWRWCLDCFCSGECLRYGRCECGGNCDHFLYWECGGNRRGGSRFNRDPFWCWECGGDGRGKWVVGCCHCRCSSGHWRCERGWSFDRIGCWQCGGDGYGLRDWSVHQFWGGQCGGDGHSTGTSGGAGQC